MAKRSETVVVHLTRDERQQVDQFAAQVDRSVSSVGQLALREFLQRHADDSA